MLEENDEFYNQNSLRPMNWLIIPKELARVGEKTKIEPKKNHHVIIEYALQVKLFMIFLISIFWVFLVIIIYWIIYSNKINSKKFYTALILLMLRLVK